MPGIPWLYLDDTPVGADARPRFVHPMPRERWSTWLDSVALELLVALGLLVAVTVLALTVSWLAPRSPMTRHDLLALAALAVVLGAFALDLALR